jgi:hypothetical protein
MLFFLSRTRRIFVVVPVLEFFVNASVFLGCVARVLLTRESIQLSTSAMNRA